MFLPYGTGALVLRDAEALRDAHFEGAAYLQDLPPSGELHDYSEYSLGCRGSSGVCACGSRCGCTGRRVPQALDEKLDLAVRLADAFEEDPNVELCRRPRSPWCRSDSRPTAHRATPMPPDDREIARQKAFLDRINAGKRVCLSSTMIHGLKVLRAFFVSHRTHADRIDGASRSCARRRPRCARAVEVYVPEMPEVQAFARRGARRRGARGPRRAAVLVAEDVRTAYGV